MKQLSVFLLATLAGLTFAWGFQLPNLDWDLQDAGKEIRAAKGQRAILSAQNTKPELFSSDSVAQWRGFSYYRVESASTGCAWLVQVDDNFKVTGHQDSIRCQ